MSRSLAEAIGDLGDVDNTSATERHIVRRACVLIVGWSAGTQVRSSGEGTPSSRRRSSVDTTLISMPASRCSRATWRRRPKAASSTPSATCCGRRSPSGTAASWNPTTPATKVTHVGRVQHRDQGGVDRQSSDRRRPGRNLRSSAPTQRSGRKPGVVEAVAHDRRGGEPATSGELATSPYDSG
jgi:hypothetical protein